VALVAVLLLVWLYRGLSSSHVEVVVDDSIGLTPTQIESIKAIGQWEFLAISDEELVDTVRKGFLHNDQLARIYYGTLRLGIDMKQVKPDWIRVDNDTLRVLLPPIILLDKQFIDEARTKSFFESGKWTAQDREQMYLRAYIRMRQHGMTPQNIRTAEENARESFRQMLRGMGFNKTDITFDKWTN
jgi:hypothetical protein